MQLFYTQHKIQMKSKGETLLTIQSKERISAKKMQSQKLWKKILPLNFLRIYHFTKFFFMICVYSKAKNSCWQIVRLLFDNSFFYFR